ncbi:MAG: molybdate ABC transporter substrate-binding protein [Nocardioides sp.]|nr:molybdate ABC transporter substrate-binding protein [Nocardioides sp.]
MTVPRARRTAAAVAAALLLLPAAACGGEGVGNAAPTRTLTVLAAASLTNAFAQLEQRFEDEHAGVDVQVSTGSSATLAQQAVAGAPADVLATADARTMATADDGGALAAAPRVFATNAMVLVVPPDAARQVGGLEDLAGTDLVVCVPSAPCGALAATLLDRSGVATEPVSLEVDVRAVLTKVTLGEADAGLVYATDARAAGDAVAVVDLPGAADLPTEHVVAPLAQAAEPELARAWVDLLLSPDGQSVLTGLGFGGPR